MASTPHCRRPVSTMVAFLNLAATRAKHAFAICTTLAFALHCAAQDTPQVPGRTNSQTQVNFAANSQPSDSSRPATVTIPAGSDLTLVLTNPVSSKIVHAGDTVYAQTTAPLLVGDQVVIPAGTFVQAKVEKLSRSGTRGEMQMRSVSIIYPDGYIATIPGPLHVESNEGTAWRNPGSAAKTGAILAPLAGLGLGTALGAAAHTTTSTNFGGTTLTSSSPRGIAIGSGVGMGVGAVVSITLLLHSRQFFVDVGSPMQMTLPQPVTLALNQVSDAVRDAQEHPVAAPMAAPRPVPYEGTCYTPGTPGTPSTVIPGTPPMGDSPGTPATVIPGTPATPPTSYPCP